MRPTIYRFVTLTFQRTVLRLGYSDLVHSFFPDSVQGVLRHHWVGEAKRASTAPSQSGPP